VPMTLSTVLQRGGRGGRDENIWCRVVLMVEASKHKKALPFAGYENAVETVKGEDNTVLDGIDHGTTGAVIGIDDIEASEQAVDGSEPEGDDSETRKAIESVSAAHGKEDDAYLQKFYASGEHCRTSVLDEAFGSPAHAPCISVNGCDNCIRRQIKELEEGQDNEAQHKELPIKQEPLDLDINGLDAREAKLQKLRSLLIEPLPQEKVATKKSRAKYRSRNDRAELEEHMLTWRQSIYTTELKGTGMSANHIITSKILTAISRIPPPVTLASLSQTSPPWPKNAHARWGASLLAIVDTFHAPTPTAKRKAEAARMQQAIKSTELAKKNMIKVEDSQKGSSGKKRTASASGSAAPSLPMVKKQRRIASQSSGLADSAISAEVLSQPLPGYSTASVPTTPKQRTQSSPSVRNSAASPQLSSPRDPFRHYRPQTHTPSLRGPHDSTKTPESTPQTASTSSQSRNARAVGTIWIQTSPTTPGTPARNSIPAPSPSAPDPSPSNSNTQSPSKKSHYREKTYKY
ncbi:hypothetical protein FRC11_012763, partial [Ceratobasidium sp. 423]